MTYLSMMSPIGPLTVFEEDGALIAIEAGRGPDSRPTPLLGDARDQIEAYFDGRLHAFDLPLGRPATPFQAAIRDRLLAIPYGAVRTYGEIARDLGTAARAVGGACGRNPLPIVVPCHRVVVAGGRLGGYSGGAGTATKKALLGIEGVSLDRCRTPRPA